MKNLPVKSGRTKLLRFGDKVMYGKKKAIFLFHFSREWEGCSEIITCNVHLDVSTCKLRRGWH
jgi:hypothetical protein